MKTAPAPRRPPVTVTVETVPGPPLDLDAWLDQVVRFLMEQEGITPAGAPPMRSVG